MLHVYFFEAYVLSKNCSMTSTDVSPVSTTNLCPNLCKFMH